MNRKLIPGIVLATLLATGIGSLSAQTTPDGTVESVNLNTSLRLWLDASDVNGNGTTPADGDPITTWVNKASNYSGEDPTQGNADKRPVFKLDGGTQFGNKPVLEFSKNNNGDFLQYTLPSSWFAPYTLFIVYQQTTNAVDNDSFFSSNNDSADTFQITYSDNGTSDTSDDGFYWRGNDGGTPTELFFENESITESKLYAVRHGGDSNNKEVKLYVNGSEEVSNGAARKSGTKIRRYRINVNRGGNAYQNSKIAEIILYDRELNLCEIEQVNLYLGAKYGKDFSNIASNYNISAPSNNDITGIGNVVTSCSTPVLIDQGNSGILQIDNASSNDVPGEFLTVGHDAAGYTTNTDAPAAYAKRIAQVWRVDEDGDLGTVNVSFNLSGLNLSSNAADFALLIDDNGTFDDATVTTSGTFNGDVITFTGVNLNNADYVSLATASIAGAISTIENYALDNSNPTPTVDDYENAGVTGVTADNLNFVNEVTDAAEANQANDAVKIQTLADSGTAFYKINRYAASNSNPEPTVADYNAAGFLGVNADNLATVNSAIDSVGNNATNTIAKIQGIVGPAIAEDVILAYADDNTKPIPSLQNYIDAGITGVTADNLMYVNEAIDAVTSGDLNNTSKIQDEADKGIAKAAAIAKVTAFADDDTQPAPTADDYTDAGYTGVTADNLTEVNAAVGGNGNANIQNGITEGIAKAKVNAFADDDTQPAPTVDDYTDAGYTGVTADNLTEVNAAVGGNGNANIQNGITEGIASAKVNAFADDDTQPAPTVDDYTDAGYTGVTADNLTEVNAAVGGNGNANIQNGITEGIAKAKVNAFADDDTQPAPTADDYTDAGYTGVTADNLTEVNAAVGGNGNANIQNGITEGIAKAKVNAFADDDTQPAPTADDYNDAGYTGVTADNLTEVNAAVGGNGNANIQNGITEGIAKAKVNAFADDDTQPAPTADDYTDAGYTGVTADNLTEVNAAVGGNGNANIQNGITEGIAKAKVNAFADDDTQPAPTADDYTDAGYTGVTADNLTEVNAAVGGNGNANIQNGITEGIASAKVNAFADDDTQPAPTADDYTDAGYTGVTADNLTEVNAAVGGNGNANIQNGITEGIATAKVNAFADDDTQPAPTADDYTDAGYAGVTADNLNEVNAAVGGNGNANIQNGITEGIAKAKVNAFADDDTQPVPTVDDYTDAGYTGVTAANLSEVNTAVGGNGTGAIQDSVNEGAAIFTIKEYVNNGGAAPTVADYTAAGISGVTAANLADVNAAALATGSTDFSVIETAANQAVTNSGSASIITDYATGGSNVPTVADYTNAGFTGVTADNLDEVNAAVLASGSDDLGIIQTAVTSGISTAIINDYADGGSTTPTVTDYANAGIVGVTADNLMEVNATVSVNGSGNIQSSVTTGIAVAIINDYAEDDTNPAPSVDDYTNAGISGVIADNLDEVNAAVGGNGTANITDAIQEGIATAIVNNYAEDNTNPAPSVDDYTNAGISGVTPDNLDEVNAAVGGNGTANITNAVQEGVATAIVNNYAEDDTNPAPSVDDYANAGISGVTPDNLDEVNAAVGGNGTANITDAVQEGVATAIVNNYAEDDTNPAPSVDDYTNAGISGVTADNLDEVNAAVGGNGTANITDAVQEGVATAIINNYAEDDTNPAPSVDDYTNAGISGVTADNLDEVNAAVGGNGTANITDAVQEGVATAIINNYAEDDTNPAPSVDDYANAGISGVTADNLDEVNAAVGGNGTANITDAVQEGVATAIINNYAEDDTNPAPSVDDYTNAGISGVTADNLDEVNAAVGGNGTANITDAVQEGVATAIINNYAEDDTNPAPTVDDYANAGVTGVTAENLDEINEMVATLDPADITDISDIQNIVAEEAAGNVIGDFAGGTGSAPTEAQYDAAGIKGVNASNLDEINDFISNLDPSEVDTNAKIQAVVDAIIAGNIIEAFADDNMQTEPTVDDYITAGVTDVDATNIADVNAAVANLTAEDLDTVAEIQAIVDAVNNGTLSNGNVQLEKFAMYPNPASNIVTINIAVEKVTIYNIAGQKVLVSKENSFDVSSLTAGVYVVEIKTSKETGVRRLVKK